MDPESGAASSVPEIPALSAKDYRKIRKGLLLEFWGLLYFPLLALISPATWAGGKYSGLLISSICTALVLWGLSTLLTVCRDGLYQRYLLFAMLGTGISWAEKAVAHFTTLPKPLGAILESLYGVAALFFLLGLRRLITYTRWWEKILRRIRTDIILVSVFLIGPSAVGILFSAGILDVGGHVGLAILCILFLVVAEIATLIHIWKTLQAIHHDAALQNNVLVIRGRRKSKGRFRGASRPSTAGEVLEESEPETGPQTPPSP
jgi:hypothetical protein